MDHNKPHLKRWEYQTSLPVSWKTCVQDKKQQLEPDMEQPIGSKLGKEYVKAKYHHPAYWTCMHSEWSEVKVSQSYSTLCDPMEYTVHGILQTSILEWVAVPFSRDLPNSGIKPRSSTLQADSLSAEPPGKPKNTGVGSLSLLQWIFLIKESNKGLLHCRQSLCQLSYQGCPL